VEEAVSLVAQHGDAAGVYAGGTELLLAMKEGLLRYEHLVNVKTVAGLGDVSLDGAGGVLSIGATATHQSLELSPMVRAEFPLLADVEHRVANIRVRNVGTVGGNLCFAEPHSDVGAALLLFDAQVEAAGTAGRRSFPLAELATGPYETCLGQGEILTRVLVPRLPPGMTGAYLKFGYHERPTLGLGVAVRLGPAGSGALVEEVRIAVGSVGPRPVRVRKAEELLRGTGVEELLRDDASEGSALLDAATASAVEAAAPEGDLHGSREYKEHLVGVFLRRALRAAIFAQ
jgi:carbon-monoxide dehydrogenase medium subunit